MAAVEEFYWDSWMLWRFLGESRIVWKVGVGRNILPGRQTGGIIFWFEVPTDSRWPKRSERDAIRILPGFLTEIQEERWIQENGRAIGWEGEGTSLHPPRFFVPIINVAIRDEMRNNRHAESVAEIRIRLLLFLPSPIPSPIPPPPPPLQHLPLLVFDSSNKKKWEEEDGRIFLLFFSFIFLFLFLFFPLEWGGGEGEVEELRWGARKPFYMGSQLGGNDRKSVSVRDSPIGCIRDDSDMFLFLFPFLSLSLSLFFFLRKKTKTKNDGKKILAKMFQQIDAAIDAPQRTWRSTLTTNLTVIKPIASRNRRKVSSSTRTIPGGEEQWINKCDDNYYEIERNEGAGEKQTTPAGGRWLAGGRAGGR